MGEPVWFVAISQRDRACDLQPRPGWPAPVVGRWFQHHRTGERQPSDRWHRRG